MVVLVRNELYGYLPSELEGDGGFAFVHTLTAPDSVKEVVKPSTVPMLVSVSEAEASFKG